MNKKEKLAKLILIEFESMNETSNVSGILNLAQELVRDAVELAKLIEQENNEEEFMEAA